MQSLYEAITSHPHDGSSDIKLTFGLAMLPEGYDLLLRITGERTELVKIAKYVCYAYDPASPLHSKHKTRLELKKAIVKSFNDKYDDWWRVVCENSSECVNDYIDWYFKQVRDLDWEAVITGRELIEELLSITREKINITPSADPNKDEELKMKLMERKSGAFTKALTHIEEIKTLEAKLEEKWQTVDEAFKTEVAEKRRDKIISNSGTAEKLANEFKNK